MRVLIVNSDDAGSQLAQAILAEADIAAFQAKDAKTAFAACLAMQPDLVLIEPRHLGCDVKGLICCLRDLRPEAVIAVFVSASKSSTALIAQAPDCVATSYQPRELLALCRTTVNTTD